MYVLHCYIACQSPIFLVYPSPLQLGKGWIPRRWGTGRNSEWRMSSLHQSGCAFVKTHKGTPRPPTTNFLHWIVTLAVLFPRLISVSWQSSNSLQCIVNRRKTAIFSRQPRSEKGCSAHPVRNDLQLHQSRNSALSDRINSKPKIRHKAKHFCEMSGRHSWGTPVDFVVNMFCTALRIVVKLIFPSTAFSRHSLVKLRQTKDSL